MEIIRLIRYHPFAKIILLATAFIGVIIITVGVFEIANTASLVAQCRPAEGVVAGNDYRALPEGGASYCPIVRVHIPGGEEFRFTDPVGTYPEEYHPGDKVAVLYNPSDPANSRIDSWVRLWLGQTVVTVVGVLVIAAGIAATVMVARMG
ncbi:MAG: DUF3592 domain-containing protein [Brevinematales bacterium]|nr:DUF3592 domain-containing protein [Brevinematales bacterium]